MLATINNSYLEEAVCDVGPQTACRIFVYCLSSLSGGPGIENAYRLQLQRVVFSSRGQLPLADSCTFSSEHIMCFFQGQLSHLEPSQDDGCAVAVLCHSRQGKGLYCPQRWAGSLNVLYEAQEEKSMFSFCFGFVIIIIIFTVLDKHTDWQPHWNYHCCSFLPLSLSLPPARASSWLLLSTALPACCSALGVLSLTETIGPYFTAHSFLLVLAKVRAVGWATNWIQKVLPGTYYKFLAWVRGPKSWSKLGRTTT